MNLSPLSVIARALTVAWAFVAGALLMALGPRLGELSLGEIAAIVAGLTTPLILLWVVAGGVLQRQTLTRQLAEFTRRQEELALQLRLLGAAQKGDDAETSPPAAGEADEAESSGGAGITVIEGEEVGPEFIHRSTLVKDEWVEVEFRNVGGPASRVMAITEGDTETRVTAEDVGSWKSVKVSLQTVNGTDQPFRFCLNFANVRGDEQQQFFRYSGEEVVAIQRPSS